MTPTSTPSASPSPTGRVGRAVLAANVNVRDLSRGVLDAELTVTNAAYKTYDLSRARLTARTPLGGGPIVLALNGQTSVGTLDVAGTADVRGGNQRIVLTRGRFRNLDAAAITGKPEQSSDLNGSLTGTVNGFDPKTLTADLRLTLDPSRYADQTINDALARVTLRRGAVAFDVNAATPGGGATLVGTARPFDALPTYAVTNGVLRGINAGAFTGNDSLRTDLNGRFTLAGRGFDPKTLVADLRLDLDSSRYNGTTIRSGSLVAALAGGQTDAQVDVTTSAGRVAFTAGGRLFDEEPTYALNGRVEGLNVGRLLGRDSLDAGGSLVLDLTGRGKDPKTLSLRGSVTSDSLRYQTVEIDTLLARFVYEAGVLDLDTLLARSNVADANAGGIAALFDSTRASDLRAAVTLKDLLPIRKLLPNDTLILAAESGRLNARLYGPAGVLRYEADAALRALVYNDLRIAGLDARSAGTIDRNATTFGTFDLRGVEAHIDVDYLAKGDNLTLRNSGIVLRYDTSNVAFTATIDADDRRGAQIAGRLDLRPDVRRVDFEALSLQFDRDRWTLVQPAYATYGDRYTVRGFLLSSGDQQIAVDGTVDPRGTQSLVATVEGFRIGALADVFGFKGLDGALSGQIDLTGDADAPRLVGDLAMDVRAYDERVGDLAVALDYADRRLGTDAVFTHRDGSTLKIAGGIPLDLTLTPTTDGEGTTSGVAVAASAEDLSGTAGLDLAITADRFSVDWIRPFLPPEQVRRLEGRLVADAHVRGQLRRPDLSGDIQLVDALVDLPALGVVYDRMNVDLELVEDAIEVQRLSAHSGGTLTGTGRINFPDLRLGEFDLNLALDGFRPIDNAVSVRNASGTLRLLGTTDRPRIEGDLRLDETEYTLTDTKRFDDVTLTRDDVLTVEQRFGIRVGKDSTASRPSPTSRSACA